jgi:hypothetical protein
MAGAYCNYCGTRCFVDRVIPDGPMKGWSGHLATCQGGMAHDLKVTGHTHLDSINPVTDPEAAAACREADPVGGEGSEADAAKAVRECRVHGEVPDDHFPCRVPGESAGQFTNRLLGYWRDV